MLSFRADSRVIFERLEHLWDPIAKTALQHFRWPFIKLRPKTGNESFKWEMTITKFPVIFLWALCDSFSYSVFNVLFCVGSFLCTFPSPAKEVGIQNDWLRDFITKVRDAQFLALALNSRVEPKCISLFPSPWHCWSLSWAWEISARGCPFAELHFLGILLSIGSHRVGHDWSNLTRHGMALLQPGNLQGRMCQTEPQAVFLPDSLVSSWIRVHLHWKGKTKLTSCFLHANCPML